MVPRYPVGGRRKVIANRGLSGIDGVVSTAIGAALGRTSSRSLALVGDVTFLHDSNGLVLGPREAEPDLTIVVVNDDGGSIFAMLEQGTPTYADRYDTLFGRVVTATSAAPGVPDPDRRPRPVLTAPTVDRRRGGRRGRLPRSRRHPANTVLPPAGAVTIVNDGALDEAAEAFVRLLATLRHSPAVRRRA